MREGNRCFIYARFSSVNQREESIEGQLRVCNDFAKKNGMNVVKTFIDRATSARTDKRKDFQRMMKETEKGECDIVLVYKLDRFARNRYDSAKYKMLLKRNGVKVVSVTENISDKADGIILESILEGYAEYYSAELSEKVIRGRTENAIKLKFNGGGMPIGYKTDENQRYAIDEKTAPFVLEAFKKYSEGVPIKSITKWLNENQILYPNGRPIRSQAITRMLGNRKYIGEYSYRDVFVPDGIPPIVPKELFDLAQKRLETMKHIPARAKAREEYLLSSKLFCGYCGAAMCGESCNKPNGNIYRYYKCMSIKRKKKVCHKASIQKGKLEKIIAKKISEVLINNEVIEHAIKMSIEMMKEENFILPILKEKLSEIEKGIFNIVKAIEAGVFTKSTKERLFDLENQKEEIELKIQQEESSAKEVDEEELRSFYERYKKFGWKEFEDRKPLIDNLVNRVDLFDDKAIITLNITEEAEQVSLDNL